MSNLQHWPAFKWFNVVVIVLLVGVLLAPTGSATVFAQGPTPSANLDDSASLPKSRFNLPMNGNADANNPIINENATITAASITNGDFEQGRNVGWSEYSTHGWYLVLPAAYLLVPPHSGNWAAWLGGDDNDTSSISQNNISFGTLTTLRLWYWVASEDGCGHDYGYVKINSDPIYVWNLCSAYETGGWIMLDLNLNAYMGQTITLSIEVVTDDLYNSNLFIDDVSLIVTPPIISGNAGVASASLTYPGGSTTADGSGNYSITVPAGWSGTVTPSKACYAFDPPNRPYSNVLSNQTNQNYTATFQTTLTISGNTGVAAVTLSYFDGTPKTVISDNNGNYTITVPCNWSGTVTPSRTSFTFIPPIQSYAHLGTNQSSQSYLASWVGGVKVEADRNVIAVGRPHVGSEVASYSGFASGSLSAYVPMLFKDAFGGSYDSALYVQNVHDTNTANIAIKYYDSTGLLNCTKADTLNPLSSKGYWVPSVTCDSGSLPAGWVGGVVVTSDQPIVAVGRPHVGSEIMTYDGFASGSLSASLPMLFKGAFGGSYNAAFYVQNTHDTDPASITIKYYDSTGLLNCTKTDTIAPLASKGYWVPTATCDAGSLPAGWVGGVVVTSDQPIVAVGRPHIDTQVTTYTGFSSGSASAYVPMLFKGAFGGSYNAAFYLQNIHESNTANITIQYYDSNGILNCTKSDTLAPLASKGYWVPTATCDTGSLPAGWVGSMVVASNQPIVAVGRPHIDTQVTTYNGFPSGSLNAYLPMLFRDGFGGSYDSALYLQNLDAANAANVTIKLYDTSGNLACTLTDTLSALASKGYWLPVLLCTP